MRKLTVLGVVVAAMLVPAAARAQWSFGARLGYTMTSGDIAKDEKYDNWLKSAIPIQLEAGYRVIPALVLGVYYAYAFGSAGDVQLDLTDPTSKLCKVSGVDCSATLNRFGIQALYDFGPGTGTNPWIGLAIGKEWLSVKATQGSDKATFTSNTFDYTLQGGVDFKVSSMMVGPYLSYGMGQFSKLKLEVTGVGSQETDIADKAYHSYISIGVRGTFNM